MYYVEDGRLWVDNSDQCFDCRYYKFEKKQCPLIEALSEGFVGLEVEEMPVVNCGFYTPRLEVVE